MDLTLFARGIMLGFGIAAPVGPIGIVCIRRTLAEGRVVGLVSGLGAATADACYGCIAGFGLTLVSTLLLGYVGWLRLIGGLYLCYLGYTVFRAPPATATGNRAGTLLRAYSSTFALTITNPMTILAFTAIFASLGVVHTDAGYASALALVGGVFLGSTLWWTTLSGGVSLLRARVTNHGLQWINRASGALIIAFGVFALVATLRGS